MKEIINMAHTKRRTTKRRTMGKRRSTFTMMLPILVPYLQALSLFARTIITVGYFYYCVVLTILNVIPNGVTCCHEIVKLTGTNISVCDTEFCRTPCYGAANEPCWTAESTCCILPEIKSFLLLSDVTNVTLAFMKYYKLIKS